MRKEKPIRSHLEEVADYYSDKLLRHGDTPNGVDWNGKESQTLRFATLGKVIGEGEAYSINDIGCGYGAYFEYLEATQPTHSYLGTDISQDMVKSAIKKFEGKPNASFLHSSKPGRVADYCVASGIFNVRLDCPDEKWFQYIESTLDMMDSFSGRGFSFNCLTSYSDADKMKKYLYYANPCVLFDFCKKKYSKQVALLHDYGLYEFTILVRKGA
jgi:SAM-dependent methyltransferase